MLRTSDIKEFSMSKKFYVAAAYPERFWLDGPEGEIGKFMHNNEGLFSDREHVIMFLLFLSEIMK